MKILSTNIAQPAEITWQGRKQLTGIYKKPQTEGIYITAEGVRGDTIGNPKVHGDRQKACYLFDTGEYAYWKGHYSDLDWEYGMFGENLSVEGLDEDQLLIGSIYSVGNALVKITAPREPCFKLGIRFGDQGIIDRFVARGKPGTYVEVLEPGLVSRGDSIMLKSQPEESLSISTFYRLLYAREKDPSVLKAALGLPDLSDGKRKLFERWATS